jgi:hypothetical protein
VGRKAVNRIKAVAWLAQQEWFADWPAEDYEYHRDRARWTHIANELRSAGLYSLGTSNVDVPVATIVREARALKGAA